MGDAAEFADPLLELAPRLRWRRYLFASHFAASWGERMWEFSSGLMLLQLGGGRSLELPAALGFAMLLTNALLVSKVGGVMDASSVIRFPLGALAVQNFSIALAASCAFLALGDRPHLVSRRCAVAWLIAFSCVAKLGSAGSKLSVEKRWAKALAGAESGSLATLNGQLRRIDLSCKIMAPVAAGFVMTSSPAGAGLMVAGFNVAAFPLEWLCLRAIYADGWCRQRLHGLKPGSPGTAAHGRPEEAPRGGDRVDALAAEGRNVELYFAQRNLWPSAIALSMLHLTVLCFGQLMSAYMMTLGVDAAVIAGYRSIGEVFGVTATVVAPRVVAALGPARAATVFIWFQLAMLVPSAVGASRWAREHLPPAASSMLLVGGVAVSRLGLWGFDLSVSQLIQERVRPHSALGAVSGVQNAIECAFGASAAVAGMLLPSPDQFGMLAFGSLASVGSAAVLHTWMTLLSGRRAQ